jgi:hypothetical protein
MCLEVNQDCKTKSDQATPAALYRPVLHCNCTYCYGGSDNTTALALKLICCRKMLAHTARQFVRVQDHGVTRCASMENNASNNGKPVNPYSTPLVTILKTCRRSCNQSLFTGHALLHALIRWRRGQQWLQPSAGVKIAVGTTWELVQLFPGLCTVGQGG